MTRGEDAAGARPGKALIEAGFCGDGGGEGHVCRGPEATSKMTDVSTHEDEGNGSGASQSANMTHRVLRVFSSAFMQNEVGNGDCGCSTYARYVKNIEAAIAEKVKSWEMTNLDFMFELDLTHISTSDLPQLVYTQHHYLQ
jgi:hypothetical protein